MGTIIVYSLLAGLVLVVIVTSRVPSLGPLRVAAAAAAVITALVGFFVAGFAVGAAAWLAVGLLTGLGGAIQSLRAASRLHGQAHPFTGLVGGIILWPLLLMLVFEPAGEPPDPAAMTPGPPRGEVQGGPVVLESFAALGDDPAGEPFRVTFIIAPGGEVKAEQHRALDALVENEAALFREVRSRIYEHYRETRPSIRAAVEAMFGGSAGEIDEIMPPIERGDELDALMSLEAIHVSPSGVIGLEFDCVWDEEHGLGVLVRDGAVVEVGIAHDAHPID